MTRTRRMVASALVSTGALLAGGCGSDDKLAATDSAGAASTVHIRDFSFTPASLRVGDGGTIEVVNDDDAAHTLTADDGSFDTGNIEGGESTSVTVSGSGNLAYHCEIHDYMKGSVEIG